MADSLLARVIVILESLVAAGEPIGPRALARDAGVDRSAVGRVLQQLVELDVLVGDGGKYEPGPRLFALGRTLSALDTLPSAATSVLSALVAQFDETCYVCTLRGNAAVFLYESPSSKPLRYVADLGRPVPLHAGAAGRAILFGLSPEVVRDLLGSAPLPPLTENTICDVEELLELRAKDAEVGYSISLEERVEGGVAVAAPFFDSTGLCQGSVVLTAPLSRFHDMDRAQVGTALRDAGAALSSRLGAPG